VDRTEVASDENNITVQGIREKSQITSAREAKLATAGLQTNSTTLCFVGLVNPREIRMQLYQWGNGMPRKILRLPVVLDRTGLSRSTVYLRVTEGRFPRPVSLGARAVGWLETEVEEWIARQIEVSREIRGQRAGVNALSSR